MQCYPELSLSLISGLFPGVSGQSHSVLSPVQEESFHLGQTAQQEQNASERASVEADSGQLPSPVSEESQRAGRCGWRPDGYKHSMLTSQIADIGTPEALVVEGLLIYGNQRSHTSWNSFMQIFSTKNSHEKLVNMIKSSVHVNFKEVIWKYPLKYPVKHLPLYRSWRCSSCC